MRVVNGKWQDKYENPIDNFNVNEFMLIGKKVKAVYGKDITVDRVELISQLNSLSSVEERSLSLLLNTDSSIAKLAGL